VAAQPNAKERVALSKELSDFLIEFSIALHRHAMYPDGHPSLRESAAAVLNQLAILLEGRATVSLGVARRQLVIEGVATDPKHPVLASLAERLHGHQIGAVTFDRGVSAEEVLGVLRVLARDAEREAVPLGLGDPSALRAWAGVRLHPLTYEQLELVEGGEEGGAAHRSAQLWIGLARAALAVGTMEEEAGSTEPSVVARAINEHDQAQAYDQVIVGYLLQIAEQLRVEGSPGAAALRRRMSRLISNLEPDTLKRLVEMGGDQAQRRRFLLDATAGMSVDAVVELVRAAADSAGQTVSNSMVRLLSKLAAAAEVGTAQVRTLADGAIREQVRALIAGWSLKDPNPEAYTGALDAMARWSQSRGAMVSISRHSAEPLRLVWMGLESEAGGPGFWRSVDRLLAEQGPAPLVRALASAGRSGGFAAAVWGRVATPASITALLAAEDPDIDVLNAVIERTPLRGAVEALLDALESARGEAVRRRLVDAGAVCVPIIVERLTDAQPHMLVKLLDLLTDIGVWPSAFTTLPYARHEDPGVRLAALRLALQFVAERERALCVALAGSDGEPLRLAVESLRQGVPDAAVPLIANRLASGALREAERLGLLRALEGVRSPIALTALLRAATSGRTLFRAPKIAHRTEATLAALTALAKTWRGDRRADTVLRRAARSKDPQIRSTVQPAAPGRGAR